MSRVVIAGAGAVGKALAAKLVATHEVRAVRQSGGLPAPSGNLSWYQADLTTLHGAEVALAGAHTVVLLAQARRAPARLQRASLEDLDRLIADSVARAAKLIGVKHLVVFSCGEADVRLPLLEQSGVPLSVLRGSSPVSPPHVVAPGGFDPVELLVAMVNGEPGQRVASPAWTGVSPEARRPSMLTCSVQRYTRPAGWSALDLARAYFKWLPSDVALVKTSEHEGVFTVFFAGVRVLVLRHVPGRSNEDCAWLSVVDGALVGEEHARFEFRVLLDGVTALAALVAFKPALPWLIYRFSQALMHERVMRRFGVWLSEQKGAPP